MRANEDVERVDVGDRPVEVDEDLGYDDFLRVVFLAPAVARVDVFFAVLFLALDFLAVAVVVFLARVVRFGAGSALTSAASIGSGGFAAVVVRRRRAGAATFTSSDRSGGGTMTGGGGSIATSPRGRFQGASARLGSRGAVSPVG